jgi:chaperonin GroEL
MKRIIENAGRDFETVSKMVTDEMGYDAKNHKVCNLIENGIIDPVWVTKSAISYAVSIVDLLINLEVLVYNDNRGEVSLPDMSGLMGMMGK